MKIYSGIDAVVRDPSLIANFGRVGLVTNQAACTSDYLSTTEAFSRATVGSQNCTLVALFGPQHGYWQTEQDNMIETPDLQFELTENFRKKDVTPTLAPTPAPNTSTIPLYSLYSESRLPSAEQLRGIDTLVVDLVDVGCRIYTYMLTLAACMKVASQEGKRVVVLDRANPLGLCYQDETNGRAKNVEGNLLKTQWHSFVGWYDIPMRHGLTLGELGHYFKSYDNLDLDYQVIRAKNLTRKTTHASLSALPWTTPSPNLPTWESCVLFPSFVLFETTNVSEGRGTTLPFVTLGAPFLDSASLISDLEKARSQADAPAATSLQGLIFRRHDFRPTFNKHHGKWCRGMQVHFSLEQDQNLQHNAFALGILTLGSIVANHPDHFRWKEPGYEYNTTDEPINLVLGNDVWHACLQKHLKNASSKSNLLEELQKLLQLADDEAQAFALRTKFAHIYPTDS